MSFSVYYIYANVYLFVFWLLYKVWLSKSTNFALNRLFLKSSVFLSLILPFLQNSVVEILNSSHAISNSAFTKNTMGIIYRNVEFVQTAPAEKSMHIDPMIMLFFLGAFLSLLLIAFNHIKIVRIIRKSKKQTTSDERPWIYTSDETEIPYLYLNKIVLPGSKTHLEQALLIEHEKHHYRFGHHYDTLMFSIFQIVFWMNPLVYLMNKSLKLVHEFQVDQELVKSDIEPEVYMNTLLKYSISSQRYMLVNAFSKTNLKRRFIMINNNNTKKYSWRYYASIPALVLLFALLSIACNNSEKNQGNIESTIIPELSSEAVLDVNEPEINSVEIVSLDYTKEKEFFASNKNTIVVLINRNSQMLIEGEKKSLEESETAILKAFKKKIDNKLEQNPDLFETHEGQVFYLSMQNDRGTNPADIDQVHKNIVSAINQVQNHYAIQIYSTEFNQLSSGQKKRMNELIPLRIYVPGPKDIGGQKKANT